MSFYSLFSVLHWPNKKPRPLVADKRLFTQGSTVDEGNVKTNQVNRDRNHVCSGSFLKPHWPAVVKQFVVTNCSKQRPGSIVNETLKSGISMLKGTTKELDSYADFKYIIFIKFSLCHQKPEKICLILENREKHPLKVIES